MDILQTIRRAITSRPIQQKVQIEDPCFWRVDMHSHLVPGVDDGVIDTEQTVACLKQLASWGIRKVITTPHVSGEWYPNESSELKASQPMLQALADENGLDIQVEVAAEYLLDEFFPELMNTDSLLTFGSARYVLVELGWAAAPLYLNDLLFRLRARGYMPILAHPERYTYYHENPSALASLHESGYLFQLNWGSLTGRYGERVQAQARLLLKKGWVNFLGSDLHRPGDLASLANLFKMPEYEQLKKQPLLNESLC